MGEWPNWAGNLPDWITCGAVIFAGSQFFADRRWRALEADRQARRQAQELTAWVVCSQSAPRRYGVVVANTSGSTFHDVRVEAVIGSARSSPPVMVVLPPGLFYTEHNGRGSGPHRFEWKLAVPVPSGDDDLRPMTSSASYTVRRLTFTDNMNRTWSSDEHRVLSRVRAGSTDAPRLV